MQCDNRALCLYGIVNTATCIVDGKTYYEPDFAEDLYWLAEYVNVGNYTKNVMLTDNITVDENFVDYISNGDANCEADGTKTAF